MGTAQRLLAAIRELGVPARTVADGLEALRWLRTNRPALILADQSAPWIDGFRICRLVKFHKKMQQIPVLIMTTAADEEHRRLAELVRADGYVVKELNPQAVVQAVRGLVPPEGAPEAG